MAGFTKMVDMSRSTAEKRADMKMPEPADLPDVPYGLCISLTEVELEKLDLEADCEIGDMLHISGMAKVTSISKNDTGSGPKVRVEMCICMLAVEDEDEETEDDEAAE